MIKDLHSFVKISVPVCEVFPHFFTFNLLKVFEDLWYVPKFLSPTFKNNFSKPGTGDYIVYFDDDSTARYQLLTLKPDISFSTQINDFSSIRFIGLEFVECHFSFSEQGEVKTNIQLKCVFKLRSRFWGLLFKTLAIKKTHRNLDTFLIQTAKEYEQFSLIKNKNVL
ncbi:hypothetical protein [Flavobacterium sp. LM4]|uniref:hypothetical protein n=1 Tax=Flavobacterium sp. LM4 TaxID=1938609 RepID=UPI0009935634|nr:hypothetical protein [Flavobacterium sp. LM4]OOV16615.1 hypothetical protein BXU10_20915 [Flavobacterium sp. LM4]